MTARPGDDRRPQVVTPSGPTPLLPVAIGLIAGVVVSSRVALPLWTGVPILLVAVLLAVARGRGSRTMFAAVLIAAASLGLVRYTLAQDRLPAEHLAALVGAEPRIATIIGRVVSDPIIVERPPDAPRAYPAPPKTRFLLEATKAEAASGPIAVTGKVRVSVKEPVLRLREGDTVRMTGWLFRPGPPQNPGAYDWAADQRRAGVFVGLSCDHAEGVVVLARDDSAGIVSDLRRHLRGYLVDPAFDEDDASAGVISAMVLGWRGEVSRAMNEAFLKTGNVHFLAASGMHVAWLALFGWGAAQLLGFGPRATAAIVGLMIVGFVLVAEPRPSILRAGVIGVAACSTAFVRGRYNSVNALSLAAIVILMIQPADLFRPAFQFSFLATLGLLHFCPLVSEWLALTMFKLNRLRLARLFGATRFPVMLGEPMETEGSLRAIILGRLATFAAQLFALSLSEWIITAPLTCFVFDRFAVYGAIGSFLLAPFAMLAVFAGFLTVFLGVLFPSSGLVMGPVLAGATDLMVGIVELLARLPGALLDGRSPSGLWVAAVYGWFFVWGYQRHRLAARGRWMLKTAAVALVVWWLVAPYARGGSRGELNVWTLAVGDGTGTVIELPDGRAMLFDLGSQSPFDVGQVAVNFLRHRGIRRIDTAFVSHPNFDHYGGIETLARHIDIGRLVINDQYGAFCEEDSAASRFLDAMRDRGIPIEIAAGPTRFDDSSGVAVESLWPPARSDRPAPGANDSSTVLRLTYKGKRILLTGDIAAWGIGGLLARGELHADVLLLPHHGSVIHNTKAFIEAVNPRIAIRSTGQRRALTTNDIERRVGDDRIYRSTAESGCVRITIRDGKLTISPMAGSQCRPAE